MEAIAVHKSESPPPLQPSVMDAKSAVRPSSSPSSCPLTAPVLSSTLRESGNVPAVGTDTPTGPSRHRPRKSLLGSSEATAENSTRFPARHQSLKRRRKDSPGESSVEEESSATSRSNARNTIESAPQRGQRQSVRVYRQSASGSDDGDIALVDGPRQQSKIIGSSGHRRGGKDQGNSNNPFSDTRPTASTSNHRDARLAKQSRVHKNDRDSDVEEVNRPEKLGMGTGKSRLDDLAYALKPPPRKTGRRPMMNKDGLTAVSRLNLFMNVADICSSVDELLNAQTAKREWPKGPSSKEDVNSKFHGREGIASAPRALSRGHAVLLQYEHEIQS
ncbi:hypothetical protein I350_02664 [Cryptococcus amylolentus CBS 6273]|uniref:Uncharacterized protein n=1 Tax=Cryptococcus amylolentus CBS 6273 TaxID=1296118 RepID=A0A1E3K7T7_9TREE|nr:hypothetical protein I350_02664 [Cryptococcus amylolentus CBS 6273]